MTEKLLTIEELITELRKLSDNTVIKVEYNQWLHNHPYGKIQVTLSIDDAKKVLVDDNARLEERIKELEKEIDETWQKYEEYYGISIDNTHWYNEGDV